MNTKKPIKKEGIMNKLYIDVKHLNMSLYTMYHLCTSPKPRLKLIASFLKLPVAFLSSISNKDLSTNIKLSFSEHTNTV